MSRAYGWNASLLIAEETEYGVLPESGYRQIPFISSSLDSEQSLVSSNVLGLGRDPTQPFQDVINVDGDIAVPVDMRNIGVWLKAIFGTPTTTENEDGSYSHAFESGKTSIPSYSLEVGLPEVPQFIRFMGVRANSIAFNFQRSGEAQVTINLMAQGESGSTSTIAAELYQSYNLVWCELSVMNKKTYQLQCLRRGILSKTAFQSNILCRQKTRQIVSKCNISLTNTGNTMIS